MKANQSSLAASFQSSSANTQTDSKSDYGVSVDTNTVTLVENSQDSPAKKDVVDEDDDNITANKPLDTFSEKESNKADGQDMVTISDEEGDFSRSQ